MTGSAHLEHHAPGCRYTAWSISRPVATRRRRDGRSLSCARHQARPRSAIKVLVDSAANTPNGLARLTREAHAIAALNHPHIVTIFSIEEAEDVRFITMELIEGAIGRRAVRDGHRRAAVCRRYRTGDGVVDPERSPQAGTGAAGRRTRRRLAPDRQLPREATNTARNPSGSSSAWRLPHEAFRMFSDKARSTEHYGVYRY
jgi:hypothetical protein